MKKNNKDIGVVVARFQVPNLHDGHKDLINYVKSRHDKIIVILGLAPFQYTYNNPLDFRTRMYMLQSEYPDIKIGYIADCYSDEQWSKELDSIISKYVKNKDVILYGSRDSFIKYYSGQYKTEEYKPKIIISGTEIREKISEKIKSTYDFRVGVIHGVMNVPSFVIPTVDLLILRDNKEILLGRKKNEDVYGFVGAYCYPKETIFDTAIRVFKEKLNVDNVDKHNLEFYDSFFIDDWKWKNEKQKITTSLIKLKSNYNNQTFEPNGNIVELRWCSLKHFDLDDVVNHHTDMFLDVYNNYDK